MPIYKIVKKTDGDDIRLVEASKPGGALAHVVADMFEVTRVEDRELFRLAAQGVELETPEAVTPQKEAGPNPADSDQPQGDDPNAADPPQTDDFGPVDPIDPNAERMANEG